MARKKRNTRILKVSFAVTLAFLVVASLALTLFSGPTEMGLPQNHVVSLQDWMMFVPSGAIEVGMINTSSVFSAGLGVSQSQPMFLEIFQTGTKLLLGNVSYAVTYYLPPTSPSPNANSTEIEIFKLRPSVLSNLVSLLNATRTISRTEYRGLTIYNVFNRVPGVDYLVPGKLAFYQGWALYTQRSPNPTGDLEAAIDVVLDHQPNLFQDPAVRTTLFASAENREDYLAIFYLTFPTQVNGSETASKTVFKTDQGYVGVYAFSFSDANTAKSSFDQVKQAYSGGSEYYVMSNYVVGFFKWPAATASNEIQGF